MTLGEGKRKVLMLIDEYSSGGQRTEDQDIAGKMADTGGMPEKRPGAQRGRNRL